MTTHHVPLTPRFSVVVPLYNKQGTIERAVRSVLSQRFSDFELIVINDGSTDRGPDLVAGIDDPRLRLISQPNRGVSAARNAGAAASVATHICFLDADDEWHPAFLDRLLALVEVAPEAGLYCLRYEVITAAGTPSLGQLSLPAGHSGIVADFFDAYRRSRSLINSSCVCVPKAVLAGIDGFPEGEHVGEDVYLWLRIAETCRVAFDARVSVTIHQDAPNRTVDRVGVQVPYYVRYYVARMGTEDLDRGLIKLIESFCRIYAAAALQRSNRSVAGELARLLWPVRKLVAVQCQVIAAAPPRVAGAIRWFREKRRIYNARRVGPGAPIR